MNEFGERRVIRDTLTICVASALTGTVLMIVTFPQNSSTTSVPGVTTGGDCPAGPRGPENTEPTRTTGTRKGPPRTPCWWTRPFWPKWPCGRNRPKRPKWCQLNRPRGCDQYKKFSWNIC